MTWGQALAQSVFAHLGDPSLHLLVLRGPRELMQVWVSLQEASGAVLLNGGGRGQVGGDV